MTKPRSNQSGPEPSVTAAPARWHEGMTRAESIALLEREWRFLREANPDEFLEGKSVLEVSEATRRAIRGVKYAVGGRLVEVTFHDGRKVKLGKPKE